MSNYHELETAVKMLGSSNVVLYDDLGKPSIMVKVPKMKYSDVIPGGSDIVLPWFVVDYEEKDAIYVSKFENVVINERAYSLAMKEPKTLIDFDTVLRYCRNKGNGWHLLQNGIFATLMLQCQRNGIIPHGNTNNGKYYFDTSEEGILCNSNIVLTGSGNESWFTNNNISGISDLVGNCSEWVNGIRIVQGEIQFIPYGNCMKNDIDLSKTSTEWKSLLPDGSIVKPGTEGTLHLSNQDNHFVIGTELPNIDSATVPQSSVSSTIHSFNNTVVSDEVTCKDLLKVMGLVKDENDTYENDGNANHIQFNTMEQMIRRSCNSNFAKAGGIASFIAANGRTYSNVTTGFRSAFCDLS